MAKKKANELTEEIINPDFGREIDAGKYVNRTRGVVARTAAKVKDVASTAERYVYKGVGVLEHQYNQKQGVGGGVRTTLNGGRILAKGLKFAAKPAIAKGKKYYENLHKYNQSFIETFTTEGKYDESRLRDAILHIAAVAEVYGKKAAKKLIDLSKKQATAVYGRYRNLAPTLDELKGKYAGIGTKCAGFIFKQDLEACLKFHNKAFQKLPREDSTLDLVVSILQDIKTNAIASKDKLLKFYMPDGNPRENKDKVRIVIDYLQGEEIQNVRNEDHKGLKDRKKKKERRRTKARRAKEN